MEDSNQFHPLSTDPVWNDVGSFRHDEFARSEYAASPANFRMALKKLNCLENAARN
jgi:hypothetical protein